MKTIKEYAEEFMQQMSDDLCIPYSATMVDLFVRYLNKYKKEIKELIDEWYNDKKLEKELEQYTEINPEDVEELNAMIDGEK